MQQPAPSNAGQAGRQPFTQVRDADSSQHGPFVGSAAPAAVAPAPAPAGAGAAPSANAAASQRYAAGSPYSDAENDHMQSARHEEHAAGQATIEDEDELISAHRKEIEVSMAAVRREMGLLSQVRGLCCCVHSRGTRAGVRAEHCLALLRTLAVLFKEQRLIADCIVISDSTGCSHVRHGQLDRACICTWEHQASPAPLIRKDTCGHVTDDAGVRPGRSARLSV